MSDTADQPVRRWLSMGQAAEYAGLSLPTLRKLIRDGRIATSRPTPGRVFVDRLEIDRVMLESAERTAGRV